MAFAPLRLLGAAAAELVVVAVVEAAAVEEEAEEVEVAAAEEAAVEAEVDKGIMATTSPKARSRSGRVRGPGRPRVTPT